MTLSEIIAQILTSLEALNTSDQIVAQVIENRSYARLARENDDYLLLLPSPDASARPSITLQHISVDFGKNCRVHAAENFTDERLTMVRIHAPDGSRLQIFGDVVDLLLSRLPNEDEHGIAELIDQLVELFSSINQPSVSTIVGLWGELFLIWQSTSPEVVARAWHASPQDKFDMTDGASRVEIKSTRGPRQHIFSYEQIAPLPNINLVVASLILTESHDGLDVLELLSHVVQRIDDEKVRSHVTKIGLRIIGADLTFDRKLKFDLVGAGVNLKYYSASDIPKPLPPPLGVTEIKFKSDLQLIPDTPLQTFFDLAPLFPALKAAD
jgi:hypothetical protein